MERRQHTKALTLHQHLPRPLQLSVRGLLVLKALNEEYRVNIFWSPFIAHTKLRCDTTNSTAELATEEHHHIVSMSSPYQPSVCKCDDKHTCTSAPLVVTQVYAQGAPPPGPARPQRAPRLSAAPVAACTEGHRARESLLWCCGRIGSDSNPTLPCERPRRAAAQALFARETFSTGLNMPAVRWRPARGPR